ncbi:MAG: NAD(P)-dependent oxidoreductase [Caldilineaceae bacterium]|nr:NAD(P)-dependent oxidoreductase [Caldilineaceae bacterium]
MLLLTGADSLLARSFLSTLPADQTVRGVDRAFHAPLPETAEIYTGDLRHQAFVDAILEDVDAVLHLAPIAARLDNETDTLDHATRGTYQLVKSAGERGAKIVLGSSLDLFATLWDRYLVDESWRPRPQAQLDQLCAYLAEIATREVVRVTGTPAIALRFGAIVDNATASARPYDPRWLHVDDAVSAIRRALAAEFSGWRIFHISAKGDRVAVPVTRAADEPLRYDPLHDFADRWPTQPAPAERADPEPIPTRPIRNVVVFGAGGPLGAAVAEVLSPHYTLRLTDLKPVEELTHAKPQSEGAPLPTIPQPPHEWRCVDVRDAAQVIDACAGMDAIVNLSVVRHDPADAFRVNTLGAFHVMQAAVVQRIHRVVHTGPFMLGDRGAGGYDWDEYIVDDVPPRPGIGWVYIPSKLLGQEICRVFADHYGLSVPTLTFCAFRNPAVPSRYVHPLSVSWEDAAHAVHCALRVETLPTPYDYFHIGADLPHGVFPNQKAKTILGWQPHDRFEELYARAEKRD